MGRYMPNEKLMNAVRLRLMRGRTWRYLRYLHMRDSLLKVKDEVSTVCVAGAGHGFAEVALAVEFPHIRFTLTDIVATGYPNYHGAMSICWKNKIDNVEFSIWNALQPTDRRFDLVCSTEMLEHVPDPVLAARNMRAAARKYVYCLAPYCDAENNLSKSRRERVFEQNEHFYVGFDSDAMQALFGQPVQVVGTYWRNAGKALRDELSKASDDEITNRLPELMSLAETDLQGKVPDVLGEAFGIKILADATAPITATLKLPPSLEELRAA